MPYGGRWNKVVNIAILGTIAVLLLNPSGVVGRWIIAGYKEWQEQRRIALYWEELVSAPSQLGPSPADGRGIVVEFVDYDCPVCRTIAPAVWEAVHNQGLTVIVRHVPSRRSGPAATEAALAAICAERYDRFHEAHNTLISDRVWLDTRDWIGFGTSLGVGDSESFASCLGGEAAQHRLARDRALADNLMVLGTPTFVSAEGLHPGAPGLVSALAVASKAASAEDQAPLRPATESLFDSSKYPDLSELLQVTVGFFVGDSGLALVDRTEIFIVDLSSNETRVVGGKGGGPEEFGRITQAVRTPPGIAVWDILRQRVVEIAYDGEFLNSQSYFDVPFKSFMNVRLVAARPDGSIVFRDVTGTTRPEGPKGRNWHPVRYFSVRHDRSLQVVAEAQGDEMYHWSRGTSNVILGHETLEAAVGDRFVVADTHRGAIVVLDWTGKELARIPMLAGVRLTSDQVRMAREIEEARWQGVGELVRQAVEVHGLPKGQRASEEFPALPRDWPTNEVAPPIDALLADVDMRLWVRDYRIPGQDSVTWRVWDISGARPLLLFMAKMDGEDTLLDAQGDRVLLRRLDAFDVPRAVVVRLVPGRRSS